MPALKIAGASAPGSSLLTQAFVAGYSMREQDSMRQKPQIYSELQSTFRWFCEPDPAPASCCRIGKSLIFVSQLCQRALIISASRNVGDVPFMLQYDSIATACRKYAVRVSALLRSPQLAAAGCDPLLSSSRSHRPAALARCWLYLLYFSQSLGVFLQLLASATCSTWRIRSHQPSGVIILASIHSR